MRFKQLLQPANPKVGDSWEHPSFSYRRVFSRGHSWENVAGGPTHPDEIDHDKEARDERLKRAEAEQQRASAEVSTGADQSASGDGDNGQGADGTTLGEEPRTLNTGDADVNPLAPEFRGEGIDRDTSTVV
jgi:hypothetical protein